MIDGEAVVHEILLRPRCTGLPGERFVMHDDGWRRLLDRLAATSREEAVR